MREKQAHKDTDIVHKIPDLSVDFTLKKKKKGKIEFLEYIPKNEENLGNTLL